MLFTLFWKLKIIYKFTENDNNKYNQKKTPQPIPFVLSLGARPSHHSQASTNNVGAEMSDSSFQFLEERWAGPEFF